MNNECIGCERDDVELKGWWAHECIENGDGTVTNALVAQPVLICQSCFEHGVLPENKRGYTWDTLTRTCYDCYRSDVVLKELTVYGWYEYYDENTRTNEEVRTSEDVGICKDCYVERNGTYEDWNALPTMYVAPEHTRYGTLPSWDTEGN